MPFAIIDSTIVISEYSVGGTKYSSTVPAVWAGRVGPNTWEVVDMVNDRSWIVDSAVIRASAVEYCAKCP